VLSASNNNDRISWFQNDGSGNFSTEQTITTDADAAKSVYACDIDGDGDNDVLSASENDDKIAWYQNDGSGNFGSQQIITTATDKAWSVYARDIDGDGDMDVLSACVNKIEWYENDGSGNFNPHVISSTSWGKSVFSCDLDSDGDMDVLSVSMTFNEVAWYENYKMIVVNTQPIAQTVCEATNSSFSVLADNVVSYQWQVNTGSGFADVIDNSTYSGSTTNNLSITNATVGMNTYIYRCQLTDGIDVVTNSDEVTFYVTDELTSINTHPLNTTTCLGSGNITLTTNAVGSNLSYQWYKNGNSMVGEISSSITFSTAFADAGTYYCEVFGDCGNETSNNAIVSIIPVVNITTQPMPSISICPNTSDINIEVIATGYNLTYQWYKNSSIMSGETDSVLTLTAISGNAGTYYCIVSDNCGNTITSDNSVVEIGGSNTYVYLTNLAFYDETVVVGNDMDGYYGLPSTLNYNSSNPYNLINAGEYVRFKIECKNNLQSGQSIVFGECSITTNSPYITITDGTSGLNNIAWGSKAWSTDEFEIYIDPATPDGHAAVFNFIVEESGNYYETSCIPVLVNPLACINEDYLIDDDSNPDSNGDDDGVIEPNETVEFLPYIDNISNYDAEITQGQFFNLNGYSDINIWNGDIGISGAVNDWSWWNYAFGNPSPINVGETHMQPQFDFVFDYNYTDTYKFTLHTIFSGGFTLFDGSPDLTLLRFASPVVFNKFYPDVPNSINETTINANISIYPNPTNGKFTVEGKNIEFIEITNIEGQLIKQIEINKDRINVDLSLQSKGIYFLKVVTSKGIAVKKVVLE